MRPESKPPERNFITAQSLEDPEVQKQIIEKFKISKEEIDETRKLYRKIFEEYNLATRPDEYEEFSGILDKVLEEFGEDARKSLLFHIFAGSSIPLEEVDSWDVEGQILQRLTDWINKKMPLPIKENN